MAKEFIFNNCKNTFALDSFSRIRNVLFKAVQDLEIRLDSQNTLFHWVPEILDAHTYLSLSGYSSWGFKGLLDLCFTPVTVCW